MKRRELLLCPPGVCKIRTIIYGWLPKKRLSRPPALYLPDFQGTRRTAGQAARRPRRLAPEQMLPVHSDLVPLLEAMHGARGAGRLTDKLVRFSETRMDRWSDIEQPATPGPVCRRRQPRSGPVARLLLNASNTGRERQARMG
jgi:hypothetical protein